MSTNRAPDKFYKLTPLGIRLWHAAKITSRCERSDSMEHHAMNRDVFGNRAPSDGSETPMEDRSGYRRTYARFAGEADYRAGRSFGSRNLAYGMDSESYRDGWRAAARRAGAAPGIPVGLSEAARGAGPSVADALRGPHQGRPFVVGDVEE